MSTITRAASGVLAASVLAVALAGCAHDDPLTVTPDDLAKAVAAKLQAQVGGLTRPTIDCGTDPIDVETGAVVVCGLSVDGDDAVYDTTVTITEVDGVAYRFEAQVAATPR